MYDSNGYIYDPDGIKLDVVKQIKEVERGRIKEYADAGARRRVPRGLQGHLDDQVRRRAALRDPERAGCGGRARRSIANGVMAVCEGANMPCTPEAIEVFQKGGVLFGPAKAANAGGVAVSGLEMCQNSARYSWTFEEVDAKLKDIMENIFHNVLRRVEGVRRRGQPRNGREHCRLHEGRRRDEVAGRRLLSETGPAQRMRNDQAAGIPFRQPVSYRRRFVVSDENNGFFLTRNRFRAMMETI